MIVINIIVIAFYGALSIDLEFVNDLVFFKLQIDEALGFGWTL